MKAGPNPKDVTQCRECGADVMFLRTKKGRRMPVNVVPTDANFRGPNAGELEYVHGEHQSHFATCSDPDRFRQ